MKLMKHVALANGLTVRFMDNSRRYFGDYHQVNVDVECDVPVQDHEAIGIVGSSVTYRRTLTKMGIPTARVHEAVAELVDHFERTALSYLSSSSFAEKFVRSEVLRRRKKILSFTKASGF